MKILKISGKNLASLAGEFCVDFSAEPLASAGLFAISGPTGAGKSTLLDALCLSLYDATPRLLKLRGGALVPDVGGDIVAAQDPRTLLRRGAGEGHAEVDFLGSDDIGYRARWSVRRSRGKVGGALQKSAMTLHRLPDMLAIGGTKTEVVEEIAARIGLTFEQFTRAVLLAQNEFSAFLKTDESERGELLETLTGSAIYSSLSKRAFERYKAEQAAMKQLGERLADHTPLAADARAALEEQCALADAELALADGRSTALEQQLRWHHEAARLQQNHAAALDTMAVARAAVDAAAPRRSELARIDAVQSARALRDDSVRLARELSEGQAAIDGANAQLAQACAQREQALAASAAASVQLQDAEQARRAAGPQLDLAKALDASIGALLPSHREAGAAREAADSELAGATSAQLERQAELAATIALQEAGAAWLAQHQPWEHLAAEWPRWDTLMVQAAQSSAYLHQILAQAGAARTASLSATQTHEEATAALTQAAVALDGVERTRQQAIVALAGFDGEQLRRQRELLTERRDALTVAERAWAELASLNTREQQLRALVAALTVARDGAAQALRTAASEATPLAAALAQAERSLQAADLACAASVVKLRAALEDDAPCPVCGSAEHPYHDQDAILDDLLASLRSEVSRCRSQAQDNLATQATQRTLVTGNEQQLAAALREMESVEASLANASAAWHTAGPARAMQGDRVWFEAELARVKALSQQLDVQERGARDAAAARDAAQQACDKSSADHARSQQRASAAQTALAQAQAASAALEQQHQQTAQRVDALLAALDAAFDSADDWRDQWQQSPDAYRSAREGDVRQWRQQSSQHAARATALVSLHAQADAAAHRRTQAQAALGVASALLARADADIGAKRQERAALWNGRAALEVEAELAGAIEHARTAAALQQEATQIATQAEVRARESQAQSGARVATLRAQIAAADARLAAWLIDFPEPLDRQQLDDMLALDGDTLAAQRHALKAIDATAATAATVLAERQAQCDLHQQSAPADALADIATLAAALEEASTRRTLAREAVGAMRLLLAQDDVRRTSAAAMMAQIERQQLIELRWGRMNELIGSADGKKFRNYAQQFTLDVLLGYANSHLSQLAKRYRLERIAAAAGPSLGLMVRDQDMGGEIRSVNSLSGGESFLVSLALALGLASLSSNRVRVESLFIDEGFGSLDSETLRVAMDALDGLQSMGRKVGVISHVQEMTERIATRILVQPSGGGTSSVTVQ